MITQTTSPPLAATFDHAWPERAGRLYLTLSEASVYSGRRPIELWRAARRGEIPTTLIDGRRLYDCRDLRERWAGVHSPARVVAMRRRPLTSPGRQLRVAAIDKRQTTWRSLTDQIADLCDGTSGQIVRAALTAAGIHHNAGVGRLLSQREGAK